MADLTITTTGAPGWREMRIDDIRGLLPEDVPGPVAEELAALETTDVETSLEDVLDALVAAGIRRAPDGVLAQGRRVVVRGACTVRFGGDDGADPGVVTHDGRGPWVDVDVPAEVTDVELLAPGATRAVDDSDGLRLVAEWQPPSVLGDVAVTRVPGPSDDRPVPPDGQEGSAAPQPTEEADAPSPDARQPAEDAPEQGTDAALPAGGSAAPTATEPLTPEQAVAEPAAAAPDVPEETGIPDYDFLFGDTQAARPVPAEPVGDDPSAAPLTTDDIDAAGGVTRGEEPGDATILPDEEPGATEGDEPSADPPATTGYVPEAPPAPAPSAGGLISAVPWARPGAGPEASMPPAPPPVPSVQPEHAAPAPAPAPAPASGPAPTPPEPSAAPAAPPPPPKRTPPSPAPSDDQVPSDDPTDITQGRDALIAQAASVDGPKVLAVICPAGHLSPPHRDTCRVCSRQVADQQAFEAARPALGVLRLESGDQVPLDRGVLLGRSPKAKADLEVARQPHVVKLPSPDNDLSRNHLEIVIDGWHVLARDLGSTNGTTVQLPGAAPTRLRPDEHVALEPGAVLVLADVVSVTFEVGP